MHSPPHHPPSYPPPHNCQSDNYIKRVSLKQSSFVCRVFVCSFREWRVSYILLLWLWISCDEISWHYLPISMKNVIFSFVFQLEILSSTFELPPNFGAMGFSVILFTIIPSFLYVWTETQITVAGSHSNSNNNSVVSGFNWNGPATPQKKN
jgi:hypothetical protein